MHPYAAQKMLVPGTVNITSAVVRASMCCAGRTGIRRLLHATRVLMHWARTALTA
jgi:hypothetical protein